MKNINWNELTPACYAIANANDVDVGVGGSMVHNNIRHGRAVDIGAENLPAAFRPDWAALGDGVDLAAENDEFNAWIRKRQGNVKALAALWNAKDYQGMIELMENAADPGPINGEKPSDHEEVHSSHPQGGHHQGRPGGGRGAVHGADQGRLRVPVHHQFLVLRHGHGQGRRQPQD